MRFEPTTFEEWFFFFWNMFFYENKGKRWCICGMWARNAQGYVILTDITDITDIKWRWNGDGYDEPMREGDMND